MHPSTATIKQCAFLHLRKPSVTSTICNEYKDVLDSWPDSKHQLPLVYSPKYNITFFGIEKLHPFDSAKFGKIVQALQTQCSIKSSQFVTPKEADLQMLSDVHTETYLNKILHSSWTVAQVTELAPLVSLPNWLLQWRVISPMRHHVLPHQISPMRYHVGGTMAAAGLAMEYGWAINLGGGMHHAYSSAGMGWCPFDDIYLAVRKLRKVSGGEVKRVLYIDLDAHQGNGVERDKLSHKDEDLIILDVFNAGIFPKDYEANPAINIAVELRSGVSGNSYLQHLEEALTKAGQDFGQPDLVFYNAGTDVLTGDPLGRMDVDVQSVMKRDEMVWRHALEVARAPIVMVLSGGYSKNSAAVVTDSIRNLMEKFDLLSKGCGQQSHVT
ncbi:hypothetical protein CEUSTIGMA_g10787.t1 [Chlamydomonas eustigma]|uniref:Histone deacetylase domain-containing protein n=1 Tax=Chlamydomonas eustigma TaxID=1157962 RepID=A0A250XKA9_9CHLO|nr:hypothetical protein CEUSTIGMA_g10787.t1 [Chlamydomonas eustigma]|eukprot:GAX83362.1 hypothetical protein CEUSTIGMA_g10787.t1 [Chlamydomonas eustigma]